MFDDDDQRFYVVVVNHEEQYSIWPRGRDIPDGWNLIDVEGDIKECLAYIEKVWTDMRPLSLRKTMAAITAQSIQHKGL